MKKQELFAAMEAVLFASGIPVGIDKMAEIFDVPPVYMQNCVRELAETYADEGRGIQLLVLDECCQLTTKPVYSEAVRAALEIKKTQPLSPAALEVLAVVAYNQPVTRGYIDQVRGLDSANTVSLLVEKELLCEKGRLDVPGRPILFGTTENFLRCFGLEDLSGLPPLPESIVSAMQAGEAGEQENSAADGQEG